MQALPRGLRSSRLALSLQIIIIILIGLLLGPGVVLATETLTLHDCIDKALKNQPSIRAAQQTVYAAEGRETQAVSPYLPQLNASTGYSESHQLGIALGLPVAGSIGNVITKSYTTSLSLNQVLYDFGKTGNALDAARWGVRSSERDLDRTIQDVVLNVKQSYYGLLAAKKLVEVAQKTIEQTEGHLKQAQAFFQAGSKPRFDVTRAEVEVNNAKLGLINARNGVRIRTIVLNNAVGIDPGQTTEIENKLPAIPAEITLEQAQADALKNRPEMLKAEVDIEAAKSRVRAEEANYFPTISANGAYNWQSGAQEFGSVKSDLQNSWNAGVMLTVPLFQGGLTRGRVSEARANMIAIEVQRDATRQSVLLEVNQSYADMESAKVRIDVMESTLQKARENLEIAQGRYEAGVGPYLEVTDAQLSAVNAETDRIQALYDYFLAAARLMKAIGRGLDQESKT
jgi:TolC family type I secretion outer membrane protein